jgi:CheY-like chemotaxis protein
MGTIDFEIEEGVGSNALSAAESPSPETTTPDPKGERIPRLLIAEDDLVTRQILECMLKPSNYNLDFVEDGMKAVEMWEKGEYDLVLMDVRMPRLNGFEATRAIREKERESGVHTPIIAMTVIDSIENEEWCLAAGMDAFISKPIDFKKSLQLIGQIIKRKSDGIF